MSAPDPAFTVLVVCTGTSAGPRWPNVSESAGTRAVVGSAMDPASARVLQELGGNPEGFRARQLTDQLAAAADLTLTMTRDHRRDVLGRAPRAMSRTFTLREAAGLLGLLDDEAPLLDADPADRARGGPSQ